MNAGDCGCDAGAAGSSDENAAFAEKIREYASHLQGEGNAETHFSPFSVEQVEEAMQKIMDEYAGGIATDYRYNESRLIVAAQKIRELRFLHPMRTTFCAFTKSANG